MRLSVRFVSMLAVSMVTLMPLATARAQAGVGGSVTPYAGYLVTGNWYEGPIGTTLSTTNAPMVGAQGTIPITRGLALVGNLAYASGELRVGLPVFGGVNVGSTRTWLYDAGLELGGLAGRSRGIAPFVQAGVGGMTSDIRNRLLNVQATNLAFTGGVGIDVGLTPAVALRVQAKDWIGRFDAQEAVGFRAQGNLSHNWALTAGVRLGF